MKRRSRSNSRSSEVERRDREGNARSGCSLIVRNIPMDTRPEDLREAFKRFGPIWDVYIPRDYYTGEQRGFAYVEYLEPQAASEAQSYMNRQIFRGDYITVFHATSARKRPAEMRSSARTRYGSYRSYHASRFQSRSYSLSRSPCYQVRRSRSYSPAPRHRENYSVSPCYSRSPEKRSLERSPHHAERVQHRGSRSRSSDFSPARKK